MANYSPSTHTIERMGIYSLSDVEHTPSPKLTIEQKRNLMESKVLWYYGTFLDDFEYHGYHKGKKEKVRNPLRL